MTHCSFWAMCQWATKWIVSKNNCLSDIYIMLMRLTYSRERKTKTRQLLSFEKENKIMVSQNLNIYTQKLIWVHFQAPYFYQHCHWIYNLGYRHWNIISSFTGISSKFRLFCKSFKPKDFYSLNGEILEVKHFTWVSKTCQGPCDQGTLALVFCSV